MSMKETLDEVHHSVELLKDSTALRDVIDKHILDHTLVSMPAVYIFVSRLPFKFLNMVYSVSSGAEECVFCC